MTLHSYLTNVKSIVCEVNVIFIFHFMNFMVNKKIFELPGRVLNVKINSHESMRNFAIIFKKIL